MKIFNKNLLNDRSKLVSALKDVYANDVIKVNMLMLAYDINVAKKLNSNDCNQQIIDSCISELINRCGFQKEIALNIIHDWCDILEIDYKIHDIRQEEKKNCYLYNFITYYNEGDWDGDEFLVDNADWWEEFCRDIEETVDDGICIDVRLISFHTKCNISKVPGKIVKFEINNDNVLKINYDNKELHFYTDADKFV